MLKGSWPSTALRVVALVIAIAAAIDPTISTSRRSRPLISLVATEPRRDSTLLRQAQRALSEQFTVIEAPLSSASGTVVVGERVPANARALAAPVAVLTPNTGTSRLVIRRVEAPSRGNVQSRIAVNVTLALEGAPRGAVPSTVRVELVRLSSQSTDDNALVVSRERMLVRGDTTAHVPLSFVPSSLEATRLQVRATIDGSSDTVRNDLVIDVREARWSVLFFDRRPSWMSTFVRRAIERDPRFVVTSRVSTSPSSFRETGRAPESLDAIAASSRFDAVVIGAPDALAARDVIGIERVLRARGASVLLLADNANPGPVDRLVDAGGWRVLPRSATNTLAPLVMVAPQTGGGTLDGEPLRLLGSAIGVPTRLPVNAEAIAVIEAKGDARNDGDALRTGDGAALPVIWRVPMGLGSLLVSGAFDTWRFRDSARSTFDATWRELIEHAASDRQPTLDIQLSKALVEPREQVSITIAALSELAEAPVRVTLHTIGGSQPLFEVVVTPRSADGVVSGDFRAPLNAGRYVVRVSRGDDTATAALVVATNVARDAGVNRDLLDAWVQSRRGALMDRSAVGTLPTVLNALITNPVRKTPWHPMRSAWWIVPFALALAGEWLLRRRRGQA